MSVLLETSLGDIVIDLFWEKAPLACKNFIKLCKVKYYNGALFYDVQKDYLTRIMHEKKEPTSLNHILYGEQAKYFEDQINPEAKHDRIGTVSTANVGPNMNDSNFFMTLSDDNIQSLNGKHTIFGVIAEGVEILRKINEVYVDERNRPYQNIRILHTPVLDDPFDDPAELEIPENSPEINYEDTDRLDINDNIDTIEGHGRTEEEIMDETKRHEAKTKAIVLEMLNDLPDAEIKPPDNVLFVCKLNPVTQEDDLETIFSQFGPIKSCEVIRDWKTGASLQYCFIEFETQAACEEAYFKMENALIDERRIHVDFSQSVAKYWYKYKTGQPVAFTGKGGKDEKQGGGRHQPRLELKRQHREDKAGYGIVIDEDEAHRERRHKDREDNRGNRGDNRGENRQNQRENPRENPREAREVRENKPREENRRRDNDREREREKEREKPRNRSGSRERRRERREEEETRSKKDRRERSRSPRRDKRDSGRDREREKERERERERERTRGRDEREHKRDHRHSEKDRKRDDHRSSRKEEKRRKKSSSSSRSSSSSSSGSGSRSSS